MLERFDIQGKRFLITGVTSGLGLSLAESLMKQGAFVIGIARNLEKMDELKSVFPMQFQGHTIDLSSIEVLEERLAVLEGGVLFDGFVHSAGILQRRPLKLINAESFDLITRVNVISGGLLVKFLFKNKLFSSDASVVFVSSVASQYAAVGNIMYMSSKGGVNSMVKGLAFELAQKGIRVNGIEPGLIKTELTGGISDEELNKAIEDYPLKRLGTTEDTNSAIQFLLSPASSWITGHLLRIDGGLTLR